MNEQEYKQYNNRVMRAKQNEDDKEIQYGANPDCKDLNNAQKDLLKRRAIAKL